MKKIITLIITIAIVFGTVVTVSAAATDNKSLADFIISEYDITPYFLYCDDDTDLADVALDYINSNGIEDKFIIFLMNSSYYYCNWTDDLNGIFRSNDSRYIASSVFYYTDDDNIDPEQIEKDFYLTLASMLGSRTNCPYKYIKDEAGVLTDEEEKLLNDKLTALSEEIKFDLVVVLTNGIHPDDRMAFSDDYYDYNGYGYGKNNDGALLLVNIGAHNIYTEGNSWISTCGSGIGYISDDAISNIGSKLTPLLLNGQFYEAADLFPDLAKNEIEISKVYARNAIIVITVIISLISAFVYCGKLKRQLITVKDATEANNYIVDNSLNIANSYDHFLYSHVSKSRRSNSSSGGSSHTSSSGTSHGGGGF